MVGFLDFRVYCDKFLMSQFFKRNLRLTFISVICIVSVFTNEVIMITSIQIDSLATCRDRITIDSITMKAFVTLTCKAELSVSAGGIRVAVIGTSGAFIFWDDFNTVVADIELETTFTTAFKFCFINFIGVPRTLSLGDCIITDDSSELLEMSGMFVESWPEKQLALAPHGFELQAVADSSTPSMAHETG